MKNEMLMTVMIMVLFACEELPCNSGELTRGIVDPNGIVVVNAPADVFTITSSDRNSFLLPSSTWMRIPVCAATFVVKVVGLVFELSWASVSPVLLVTRSLVCIDMLRRLSYTTGMLMTAESVCMNSVEI